MLPAHRSISRVLRRTVAAVAALTFSLTAGATVTAAPAGGSSFGDAVVAFASQQAGVPYLYGGTTPAGFDCSGLVGYVFAHFGVSLPRTADDQYYAMQHVPQADAAPGDVLFLPDSTGYMYHNGIYAGGGYWWVARHTGTVVERQALWTTNYVVGRVNSPAVQTSTLSAIQAKYGALGGTGGFLGAPVTPELPTPDHVGAFTHYSNGGSIYWTPATAAHEVHGAIRATWSALGWETSVLGYPVTDENVTPDGVGRYNHFTGGSVYWTAGTGAHEVHGAIRGKWAALGWETYLGYPTTNESRTPDGVGRYNHFSAGSVYWTPATGAHEVHGAIRDRWAALGWELSSLGYPTSDEYAVPNGRRSDFQGGSITWTPAGGATVVAR